MTRNDSEMEEDANKVRDSKDSFEIAMHENS